MARLHRALALALAAAIPLGSAAAKPPVEAFSNLPAIRSPGLSPDGKKFAAIQEMNGRPVVAVYTIDSDAPPLAIPSSEWVIWGFQWVSNEKLVIMASQNSRTPDERGKWTLHRTVAISADGSNPVALMGNVEGLANNSSSAHIADIALNDPDHIYVPLYVEVQDRGFALDLFQVDLTTGRGKRVAHGDYDTRDWIMDGKGGVVARIDETKRPPTEHLMVPDGDDWREVAKADVIATGGVNIAGLTDDGAGVVRGTLVDGRFALTRLDLATGKETVLLSDPRYDVAGPIVDEWTGRVIGGVLSSGSYSAKYFDPQHQRRHKALFKAFPNLIVFSISADLARDREIVVTEAPRQPAKYYLVDRATKTASEVGSSYPGLTEADLGEMKPYDYTARDGLLIPAFITLPPGKTPKNLPAVVMPHGGPDSSDGLGFDWWAQFMANRGYVVLQPNFRGSSGYGTAFTEAGLQQWGLKMQDDITDGVMKMIADGIVDPKRVCIVGASYGGYAALAGATLTPDLYACVVSIAGVSDLPKMISHERRMHGSDSGVVSFWISRIGSPTDDSERLRATSPARHADAVKAPVLLMHPENDTTVPIAQSELMAEELEDAGKSVRFVELEGDDHYLQLSATRYRMLTELEAFLAANIGN